MAQFSDSFHSINSVRIVIFIFSCWFGCIFIDKVIFQFDPGSTWMKSSLSTFVSFFQVNNSEDLDFDLYLVINLV